MNDLPVIVGIALGAYLGGAYGAAEAVVKDDSLNDGFTRTLSRAVIGIALGILGAINVPTVTLASLIAVVISARNVNDKEFFEFTSKVVAGAVQGAVVAAAVFAFAPPAVVA